MIHRNERDIIPLMHPTQHSENVFISHAKFNQNFRSKIEINRAP